MEYPNGKILFGTDFSFISEYALNHAVDLAQQSGSLLIVMHVINISLELCRSHESEKSFEKIRSELAERERERVATFCRNRLRYWNTTHEEEFTNFAPCVAFGLPWLELLNRCEEENVGALVIGTHSSHEISPSIMGSTAKKLLEKASIPVVIVRPPFWMICMKFRNHPALPFARTEGSFITPRRNIKIARKDAPEREFREALSREADHQRNDIK